MAKKGYMDRRMLRELNAFRELVELEPRLEKWPHAVPLLERAAELYDVTDQPEKKNAVLKRLVEVAPGNKTAQSQAERKKRSLAAMLDALDDEDRQRLEDAREIVKADGKIAVAKLQRKLNMGYNHAARLADVLRAEQELA